jgi:hypothetical protein
MATVSDLIVTGSTHPTRMMAHVPYVVENYIDFADAADSKGSALAAADVIQALHIPAGSYVLFAGLQVIEVATGESADVTLDFGVTGGDVDAWVDGFDLDAAAAGAFAAAASASITPAQTFFAAADTLDILIATATTAPTGGVVRAFAVVCDVSEKALKQPSIAQLGS